MAFVRNLAGPLLSRRSRRSHTSAASRASSASSAPPSIAPAQTGGRSARGPLAYPAALAGIDFARLTADLDGTFRRHGARTQPAPADLTLHHARSGFASIATFVLESDLIARAVVSHVRVAPFFTGVAITVHPHATIDAPLLVADLMVLPPGSSRAFLDACGPAIGRAGFATRFLEPLAAIVDGATGVGKTTVPAWIAPLSGGNGARLRASRGAGEKLARVVTRYVDRYLAALATAPRAVDPAANLASVRTVRDVMRAHGPAQKHLSRAFGETFTSSYMRLVWRDDAASV
jgi:hypothetical protein